MVLLYPTPTVFSKHVLVPFNENGARLGAALERDAALQTWPTNTVSARVATPRARRSGQQHGIHTPARLVDVIDPPSYDWLEKMITGIEQSFK